MNKILSSQTKELTFVLQGLTDYNIDFVYHKKANKLSFCSRRQKKMRWRTKVYVIQKGSTLKITKGTTLEI